MLPQFPSLSATIRSSPLPVYSGMWTPLVGGFVDGELTTVRSSWLCRNPSAARAIARDAFSHLFGRGHYFVEGLGGNHAVDVLAGVMRQIATDDPRCLVVVSTARSTVLVMTRIVHTPATVVSHLSATTRPRRPVLPLFRYPLASESLELPKVVPADRSGDIRMGHPEKKAPMRQLLVDQVARDAIGNELYRAEKWDYTRATTDDLRLIHAGKPVTGRQVGVRMFGDRLVQTVIMPTLMVYELRPRGQRFTNYRLGLNFSHGGETVVSISSKTGDLERYLEFFDPQWETAIRSQLCSG
ncbi:MAG: hypothetical protein AB7G17_07235 [Phycisphaerales bacterium]